MKEDARAHDWAAVHISSIRAQVLVELNIFTHLTASEGVVGGAHKRVTGTTTEILRM